MRYPHVCRFIGNRNSSPDVYPAVVEAVGKLIRTGITEFWSGGYGAFDGMGERAVLEWKRRGAQVKLVLVLAYPPKPAKDEYGMPTYQRYDELYQPDLGNVPPQLAIAKRNAIIARQAGHALCYVPFPFGGAAKTLEIAQKSGAIIHAVYAEKNASLRP